MAKSTQTAFENYNSTLTSRIEERIKEEKAIKSAINRAYVLDTGIKYSKEAKKMQIEKDLSQGFKLGRDFEEAKSLDSKSDLKLLRDNFKSQRLSEAKAYFQAVEDGSMQTFIDNLPKKKDRKPITSISYLLKLYKKSLEPSVDETAEAETPDVGTSEAQAEPQQETVKIPLNTEEDFVALMIERGLDLDKVVEIIFDLDNVKKVA
mgnify:FL=1